MLYHSKLFQKVICFAFGTVFFVVCVCAMHKPVEKTIGLEGRARPQQGVMILIDQHDQEIPKTDSFYLTFALVDGLNAREVPIILTSSLLENFLVRNRDTGNPELKWWKGYEATSKKKIKNVSYAKADWKVDFVPDTQLFLTFPREKSSILSPYFKLEKTKKNQDFFDDKDDYKKLISFIEQKKGKELPPVKALDFEKTFKTFDFEFEGVSQKCGTKTKPTVMQETSEKEKEWQNKRRPYVQEQPIWNIYFSGHGLKDNFIAGLPIAEMQSFLQFCNDKIDTGILIIASCYTGGTNIEKIKFQTELNNTKAKLKNVNVLRSLNYIVIVVGIDENVVHYPELNYKELFKKCDDFGKGKCGLEDLLKKLYRRKSGKRPGYTNIPQVFLPGGIDFQTLDIDDQVKSIGNVLVRVHKEEKEPIVLWKQEEGKTKIAKHLRMKSDTCDVALIFPKEIDVPIFVKPNNKSFDRHKPFLTKKFFRLFDFVKKEYEVIQKLGLDSSTLSSFEPAKSRANIPLYPFFIQMEKGNSYQHYVNIKVFSGESKAQTDVFYGVHTFMRDAFLGIKGRPVMKAFLIDSLTGNNDLYWLLKIMREVKNTRVKEKAQPAKEKEQPSKLEKILEKYKSEITLKNVMLNQAGDSAELRFEIDNTAWIYSSEENLMWEFKKVDLDVYRELYDYFVAKTKKQETEKGFKPKKQLTITEALTALKPKEREEKAKLLHKASAETVEEAEKRSQEMHEEAKHQIRSREEEEAALVKSMYVQKLKEANEKLLELLKKQLKDLRSKLKLLEGKNTKKTKIAKEKIKKQMKTKREAIKRLRKQQLQESK